MNQSVFRQRFGFALVLVGLSAGCATFSNRADVSVNVVDLQPTQASVFETGAALTLRFTNESTLPLVLKGSSHRLHLNGSYVGRAVSNDPLTVSELGTVTQTVTFYLENLTLVRKAVEFSHAPTAIEYRLESQLYPTDQSRGGRLRTTTSGKIDLRGFFPGNRAQPPS